MKGVLNFYVHTPHLQTWSMEERVRPSVLKDNAMHPLEQITVLKTMKSTCMYEEIYIHRQEHKESEGQMPK